VVITSADGSETMEMLRLKVANGAITEMEILRTSGALTTGKQRRPNPGER
jgi:hypothetical protein